MRIPRSIWLGSLAWLLASLTLFLIGIEQPSKPNFDEFHYIPAAKQFLKWNMAQNLEHPPLGKEIMAVGIALFGDNPLGWRSMAAFAGSLTLVAIYFWSYFLFESVWLSSWVALVTLANHLLFVQARIGMLDTFMFLFLAWAFAFFTLAWMRDDLPRTRLRKILFASGICFGFATASKWAALVPWAATGAVVCGVGLLKAWGAEFRSKKSRPGHEAEFYTPDLWPTLRKCDWLETLLLSGGVAYGITFLPYLFFKNAEGVHYSFLDLFAMQPDMWRAQLRVAQDHPYMSHWIGWAILRRPIWYAFEREHDTYVRGVLLLGNPLVMWAGFMAWLYTAWAWLRDRSRPAFLIFFVYAVLYFGWAVIPRKISFYYYYYPAGMVLSLALGYCVWRLKSKPARVLAWTFAAACVAIFAYFYPILAARLIPADSFRAWMWFSSWI